jgi:hypothetical protein
MLVIVAPGRIDSKTATSSSVPFHAGELEGHELPRANRLAAALNTGLVSVSCPFETPLMKSSATFVVSL